jgi:aquaporin rerated protein, other eukaryote
MIVLFSQLLGGLAATLILLALNPPSHKLLVGLTLANDVSPVRGFCIEMILSAVGNLCILTLNNTSARRASSIADRTSVAATIGASLALANLVGMNTTGAGLNPARAFGPAIVLGVWPRCVFRRASCATRLTLMPMAQSAH